MASFITLTLLCCHEKQKYKGVTQPCLIEIADNDYIKITISNNGIPNQVGNDLQKRHLDVGEIS